MATGLKIGDQVLLKSGSDVLTVAALQGVIGVTCRWYNRVTGTFETDTFHPDMLEVYKPPRDDEHGWSTGD